jgi:tRNA 2-thiouridine synthesizing protein A
LTKPQEDNTIKVRNVNYGEKVMAVQVLDTLGLKCPQPVLKVAVEATDMVPGDILEVVGDCPTFEKDLRIWCERMRKVFLSIKHEGGNSQRIQIQF